METAPCRLQKGEKLMAKRESCAGSFRPAVDGGQARSDREAASTPFLCNGRVFVAEVCMSDSYAMEVARIALARSRSVSLRALEIAGTLPGAAPIERLDEVRQGMIGNLTGVEAEAFDPRCVRQQPLAHAGLVHWLDAYLNHGDLPQLRSFTGVNLPPLQRLVGALERMGAR
jgi:hypothetical protein